MAITIKSGKRGRPITVDIEELSQEFYELKQTALPRLAEIRRTTKGIRDPRILGTKTSAPDWVSEAEDLIDMAENGRLPSYAEIKDIQSSIKSLRELSSKQARVYQRAISEQLTKSYLNELDIFAEDSGKFTKSQVKQIRQKIESMTPRQKQQFLTSKSYQSPLAKGRYKRIRDWAQADSGKKYMTYEESWAYVYLSRLKDGLVI